MKYISFIIPCFNSSEYMRHCIESCLVSDDVEVLIIDDGSKKDNTLDIAKEYEQRYKGVCRAIHKENGGHGSVVNRGIEEATGLFLKVVDSDDWLDSELLKKILENIKKMVAEDKVPDLIISNYIYDKVGQEHKKVMRYADTMASDKILTWDDIKEFKLGEYLLMHSLMYKTSVLKNCNLNLPEHTFYVDNIFAYKPLPYVHSLIYYDYNLYHYYIGREDQSVNEKIMIGRLDQQYRVTYKMLDDVDIWSVRYKRLQNYMINYMSIIMTVSSILSIRS
ncbi:MAG: glycosyltransferase, partial [Lachnospiraceae bacterium]|nr:glycosyltransferase [Lachnospiraceae bacterium]